MRKRPCNPRHFPRNNSSVTRQAPLLWGPQGFFGSGETLQTLYHCEKSLNSWRHLWTYVFPTINLKLAYRNFPWNKRCGPNISCLSLKNLHRWPVLQIKGFLVGTLLVSFTGLTVDWVPFPTCTIHCCLQILLKGKWQTRKKNSQPNIFIMNFLEITKCLKCSITWVSQASFTTLFASHVKASARNGKALGPLASTNLWIFVGGIRTDLKHGELGELWFKIKHTCFNLNFQTDIIGCHLGDLSFEAYKTFHVNVNYAGFLISFLGGSLTDFPTFCYFQNTVVEPQEGLEVCGKLLSCDSIIESSVVIWLMKFSNYFGGTNFNMFLHHDFISRHVGKQTLTRAGKESSRVLLYCTSTVKHT